MLPDQYQTAYRREGPCGPRNPGDCRVIGLSGDPQLDAEMRLANQLPANWIPVHPALEVRAAMLREISPKRLVGSSRVDPDDIVLEVATELNRTLAEQFILNCFDHAFKSQVKSFMPTLVTARDTTSQIRGAFGVRNARQPLFLEQYLDQPIEVEISARNGSVCERNTVVEVGHLSGTYPGIVRQMIGLLTKRLHDEGIAWVAFTGTTSLRNAFARLGLAPQEIAMACRDRLPAPERDAWGSYYDGNPRVFIGNVAQGYQSMLSYPIEYSGFKK